MPKKTKKEKIIAEARRVIQQSRTSPSVSSPLPSIQEPHQTQTPYQFSGLSAKKTVTAQMPSNDAEFTAIRRDIVKTVLLAGAAIAIEFIIYFRIG